MTSSFDQEKHDWRLESERESWYASLVALMRTREEAARQSPEQIEARRLAEEAEDWLAAQRCAERHGLFRRLIAIAYDPSPVPRDAVVLSLGRGLNLEAYGHDCLDFVSGGTPLTREQALAFQADFPLILADTVIKDYFRVHQVP